MPFENRTDAGRQLARALHGYAGREDVVVLALPRGGVPVAWEVARELNVPLGLFLVRKLGAPGYAELAMGAIASGGIRVLQRDVIEALNVREEQIATAAAQEQRELQRRERAYLGDHPPVDVEGQTVVLIDDGLATGATMKAAVMAIRAQEPRGLVVAVPTAAPETCTEFAHLVDDVVCLETPANFGGVGRWYRDFSQTTDEEVRAILDRAERQLPPVPRKRTVTTGGTS